LACSAAAVGLFVVAACSSTQSTAPTDTAPPGTPSTTAAVTLDDEVLLADAKSSVNQYFQAHAVNDYELALGVSDEAAAWAILWARGVNGIDALASTTHVVPSLESPNVRIQIDRLRQLNANRWRAEGFVELGERPGGVATTSTTTPASPATSGVTYVTDMEFAVRDGKTVLVDYRYDDVAYPVSQLYLAITDSAAESHGLHARLTLGHRDVDGDVLYLADVRPEGSLTKQAGFVPEPPTLDEGTTTTTAQDAAPVRTTEPVDLFADPAQNDERPDVLLLRRGAFPGRAGTFELAVDGPDDGPTRGTGTSTTATPAGAPSTGSIAPGLQEVITLSLPVPPFPPADPRPTNTVRDSLSSTTTSSSSTTSSTSTTASTLQPSTTVVTVTVVPPTVTTRPTITTPPTVTVTVRPTTTSTTTTTTSAGADS
jgi:hypothetical protein